MKMQKYYQRFLGVLFCGILLLCGRTAVVIAADNGPEKDVVSSMNLKADFSYVQGSVIPDGTGKEDDNTPSMIPLRQNMNAYFSFKAPVLKDFLEKAKVYNERLDYCRALFGFNISF